MLPLLIAVFLILIYLLHKCCESYSMVRGGKKKKKSFVIKELLSSEGNGTVYLAEMGDEKLVYKIERMDVYDKKKPLESEYYRQLKFDKDISRKHPDKFLTIRDHGIIKNCDYIHPRTEEFTAKFDKNRLDRFIRKNSQPNCYYLLYSPFLDGNFTSVRGKIMGNPELFLDFMYQIVDSLNIVRKAGYSQNDMGPGNMMYKKRADGHYQWYIIDYGNMYNKNFPTSALDKDIQIRAKYGRDLYQFCDTLIAENFREWRTANLEEKLDKLSPDIVEKLAEVPESEYPDIKKYTPSDIPEKLHNLITMSLLMLLYPKLLLRLRGASDDLQEKYYHTIKYTELVAYCVLHHDDKNYDDILKKIASTHYVV